MDISTMFMLDPSITFLNHGSFGATPKVVFENYQYWQKRLEYQPVKFLGREYDDLLLSSRRALGAYINSDADDLVYIPNATFGVNLIAHSLELKVDDEILTTDHEYGACDLTWEHICRKAGAKYKRCKVPFPMESDDQIIEILFKGVTNKTKILYISHITSPTAIIFPVEKICKKAKELGIISIIDGAHATGQVDLDMQKINADVYIGNCHKWLMSPKGAGFIYCNKSVQQIIEPLVVSWGSGESNKRESRFINILQWSGTNDPAAYLSVPAAIQFIHDNNWAGVKNNCRKLLEYSLAEVASITCLSSYYNYSSNLFFQMATARIPDDIDLIKIKTKLYEDFNIEVPFTQLDEKKFIRISIQGYNTEKDIERLLFALKNIIS